MKFMVINGVYLKGITLSAGFTSDESSDTGLASSRQMSRLIEDKGP